MHLIWYSNLLLNFFNNLESCINFLVVKDYSNTLWLWGSTSICLMMLKSYSFNPRFCFPFWGDYIFKNLSSPILKHQSFLNYYKKQPNYQSFRTGCFFYYSTLQSKWKKSSPCAILVIYLACLVGLKTHKLYDLHHNNIISRDLIFHENIFSFHSITQLKLFVLFLIWWFLVPL